MALSRQEQAELVELESQGLSGGESDELAALQAELEPPSTLDRVGTFLDYDRGVTGGPAIATALEAVTGKDVFRADELAAAAKMQKPFPGSAELMDRAGILKDWPKTRFATGLALDVASSPSTYATGGLAPLGKLLKGSKAAKAVETLLRLTQPGQEAMSAVGKGLWKRPFKHMDAEAIRAGKKVMPSQILTDAGVAAVTRKGLHEQTAGVADQILQARNQILQEATDAGGKIDVDIATGRAQELVDHYRALGIDQADEVANALEQEIAGFERLRPAPARTEVVTPAQPARTVEVPTQSPVFQDAGGRPLTVREQVTLPPVPAVTRRVPGRPGASPSQASDIKTFFYKGTPSRDFAPYAETPQGKDFNKALALGLKDASEVAVEQTLGPEAGFALQGLNDQLGSLLSTRKKDLGQVTREEMRALLSGGDAMAIGAAAAGEGAVLPRFWAIKKGVEAVTSPGPWTILGRGMTNQARLPARATRTLLKRAPVSPWSLMEGTSDEQEAE